MFKMKHKWYQQVMEGGEGETDVTTDTDTTTTDTTTTNTATETTPAYWPDDWRQKYAGENETKLNQLSRYASPEAAFDAGLAAQNRIRSGELKAVIPFPGEGTDEEKAGWRTENGLPTEASGYDLTFDDGFVVGEEDKPYVDSFLETAHTNNMTNEQVKAAVAWNEENKIKQEEAQEQVDKETAQTTIDALNAEWGTEYRGNINRIHGMLDMAPEGVKENILGARGADGVPVFSDLDSVRWFANLALEMNPATTLVPADGGNIAESISDEIASIEAQMGDRSSEYFKGPKDKSGTDTVMAVRYRQLVDARDKMKSKAG